VPDFVQICCGLTGEDERRRHSYVWRPRVRRSRSISIAASPSANSPRSA
jgi:hypothetical protein